MCGQLVCPIPGFLQGTKCANCVQKVCNKYVENVCLKSVLHCVSGWLGASSVHEKCVETVCLNKCASLCFRLARSQQHAYAMHGS